MENTRKHMEEEITKQMAAIGEELTAIRGRVPKESTQYTDRCGKTHYECPWAYDDYLSRAMASDMFSFYPMFHAKYPELAEHVMKWTEEMTNLNYRLMRMFDDDEGNRPLRPWNVKETLKLMEQITAAVDAALAYYEKNHDETLKDFLNRCHTWVSRIMYMDTWAFYLETMAGIDQILFDTQLEMFDNDGNDISDLNKNERAAIKSICAVRKEMLKLLVAVPVDSNDHRYLMDKLKMFDKMCHVIIDKSNAYSETY